MNTAEKKVEMFEFIASLQDEQQFSIVYSKFREAKETIEEENDWFDELTPMQQAELEASIKECDNPANLVPHEEAVKMIDVWLKR
jgi:hypothetical protein